jgi:D-sedoheptulose 7-phosphate isomerase
MTYSQQYLDEAVAIIKALDSDVMERMADQLAAVRTRGGRLFILGVGGGAGHAGHAVNDFRKIGGIESYAPTDNVSELTARTNDEGWETAYAAWLQGSRLRATDLVLVFSVGGGDPDRGVSVNLVRALELAHAARTPIIGIVGRDGGLTKRLATECIVVPTVNPQTITPHTEAFQAVIWHLLVTHPRVQVSGMKWEGIDQVSAGRSR